MNTENQERLLAGAPFADGGELDEIASFMRALPAYAREEPGDLLTTTLVPRLAQEARASTPTAEKRSAPTRAAVAIRHPLSRRALVARVAVAVALVPASMAALAVAGVHLPDPAKKAFEGVGVELPNQSSDTEGDEGLPSVPSEAEDDDSKTTDNGRGKGNAPGKPSKNVPPGKALGHEKAPGQGGTPPGKALGQDKSKSNQGGGSGSSSKGKGSSGKAKKSPAGRTKPKPPKPPPPPQAKGKVN